VSVFCNLIGRSFSYHVGFKKGQEAGLTLEGENNQKFVWLKVASINISRSTVSDCAPFLVVPFLFDIERN
jgi:hypothetical protein